MKFELLKEDVIKKSDFSIKIKIEDIKKHYQKLGKRVKELEAQILLEEGKIKNYKEHNPIIEKTKEKDRNAIAMHHVSFLKDKRYKEELENTKKSIKIYKKEVEEINRQTKAKIEL